MGESQLSPRKRKIWKFKKDFILTPLQATNEPIKDWETTIGPKILQISLKQRHGQRFAQITYDWSSKKTKSTITLR